MAHKMHQRASWRLTRRQHGIVTRGQLLELGLSSDAIKWRITTGRLHVVHPGVYAVGRPEVTRHGRWMAAVLACGPGSALSHGSAAALWEIGREGSCIHVSVNGGVRRHPGIRVHRRAAFEVAKRHGLPVTTPACTLVDLATCLRRDPLEAAIGEADKLGLIDPERLRRAIDEMPRRPGLKTLRETLDRRTFVLTDSALERLFLPIARGAGLPKPLTRQWVNGFRVDFYWPDLGLVVETDGLTYHRTPAQQARDSVRSQTHSAAGLTPLRFTHEQVKFEPEYVQATLALTVARLAHPPTRC